MGAILKRIRGFGVSETSKDKRTSMIAYEPEYLEKILGLLKNKNFYHVKMHNNLGEIWFNENGKLVLKFSFPLNLYSLVVKLNNLVEND